MQSHGAEAEDHRYVGQGVAGLGGGQLLCGGRVGASTRLLSIEL